ncbi:hypothetical protein SAMN04487895_10355 [Paenibacillus sophorae]|uniref:Uncharacterized protein n=1 Tax=Paenibacillus sophorae TaxID=1333845 RepID=A0A1H8JK04_9BACL|nr:hypothetical protein [Paenibacillus sophorae]QWU13389.1 hypothetical protein KP014_15420 [Paenibacillus sophorae]SEN81103.1 hypothetical protein SAMN04487895_10355 [Paenibacillus sophorae]
MNINNLIKQYQSASEEDKRNIVYLFASAIWKSEYRGERKKKTFKYKVINEALNNKEDLIVLFNKYNYQEYYYWKSFYKGETDPINDIRIKINNIYAYYFRDDVYLDKLYYELLRASQNIYYRTIDELKKNKGVDVKNIEQEIIQSIEQAKRIHKDQTIELSWKEYKSVINDALHKIFRRCKTVAQYENEHGWDNDRVRVDSWSQDNLLVSYIGDSLRGEVLHYIRDNTPKEEIKKYCERCGEEISITSNRRKWCNECKIIIDSEQRKIRNKRYYKSKNS